MRERHKMLLILSQSLIGTGFFFLYMLHVRSIFESRSNIAHLTQLERESLFRREDALYYSFYKTLTEAPDFWSGYKQLQNVTGIEHPRSINVVQRFQLLPELTIGYFYHQVLYYGGRNSFLLLSCWRANDIRLPIEHRHCDTLAQPMQFYLECVWLMGGLTILIIYMYGALLSGNIFGGIYAVVSYVMFHSYASKIYERPAARENFAFPIIFLQMFFLSLCLGRVNERKTHSSRIAIIAKLTLMTAASLLCWQFSSVIFATQLFILLTPWGMNFTLTPAYNTFAMDYALSQFLANVLAFFLSMGNKKYFFTIQVGPAIGAFFVSLMRVSKAPARHNKDISMKAIALGILMASSAQSTILDLLEKMGFVQPMDNAFALYRDLSVHWGLQAKLNFVTSLAACSPAYRRMEWGELWELVKTLVVKPYCMYGVVMLARFFRKWRKAGESKTPNTDYIERAKKYVLEDFLEENRVSMRDMSTRETETVLNECLRLLGDCDYDYERYKAAKSQIKTPKPDEHEEFISHIKKLKEQINELNETKRHKEREEREARKSPVNTSKSEAEEEKNASKAKERRQNSEDDDVATKSTLDDATESAGTAATADSHGQNDAETNGDEDSCSKSTSTNEPRNDGHSPAGSSSAETTNIGRSTATSTASAASRLPSDFLSVHYLYSVVQLVVFAIIGLSIKKLFFLCFTQGCVIAPTLCSKFWYRKQRNIFWTISLTVFFSSMVDPGVMNVREEYFPTRFSHSTDDLDSMLEWIKMNTEKDAVFAGPIEIIGTVHLTTKRPIVNHAHLEMRQISERTEHVYSVFSRQQSSDIYNQCSQLKIQYLIVSIRDCSNDIKDECDLLSIWDDMQPAYRKYPQFCSELANKNIPSFLKVFANDHYGIIKMFSQSVQINLRYSKMPEKIM